MIESCEIRLAATADAPRIAALSRDVVEHGLGWAWDAARIARRIRHAATNVIVARSTDDIAGFALMEYRELDAHLLLFGVEPFHRNQGIGTQLLLWLETTAATAGIELIFLEARATNATARAFYHARGYRELALLPRYYAGREDGVRIGKDLAAAATP